ncbi:hypothetical protein WAE56_10960 [Iodobacter sp. LRB]|uniref:hypothetical protein n=1 Tax=unclassified Iodobacter TaxID=235634 RepID=UPI000C0F0E87|nr:hypothetical protein [Iodobacter sp. BJB302]PHV01230.1 hypothetical protein CSQ88_13255 [Iodobacter sp. BJB302]
MTKDLKVLLIASAVSATLAACGGGGSSSTTAATTPASSTTTPTPTPNPSSGTVPAPNAAATTVLDSSQSEANKLSTEATDGLSAAQSAAAGTGVKGPLGVEIGSLPTGISSSISCSLFGSGGSGSISYDIPTTGIAAGTVLTYTYNQCNINGLATYNGTFSLTYNRYVSPSDFSYTSKYTNFTVNGNGFTNQAINGSSTCDFSKGAMSCYYSDGTRGWSSNLTYSNGTVNGSYAVNYGTGTIQVKYTNFNATSGSCEITGANGSKALITRTSAKQFTVSITGANGSSTSYTVNT